MSQLARAGRRPRAHAAYRTLVGWAPALLALSVLARLLWMVLTPNGLNLVDLHVYVDGSAALLSGDLYGFTYSEETPEFPLPFTYPPFAALVFLPLHYLPFSVVGFCWQLCTVLALYWVIRISLELLVGSAAVGDRHWKYLAMLWTAIGVWTEPVRTTLDYGQVNVFLVLGAMLAVRSTRWWVSGGIVGILAGIKLTPAVTGLYFVAQRRWRAAVFSAIAFFGTIGLSYLVISAQARDYFTSKFGDADRIGPVGSAWNQSLRGALSRIVGHDVESGPVWLIAVALSALLAFLAWRALARDDRLGTLVLVQLFGLLISPISWVHHWVWVLPMLIWLVHGPYARMVGTRVVASLWLIVTVIGVPWVLKQVEDDAISRPGALAWAGTVNVAGALVVFAWVAYAGRRVRATQTRPDRRSAVPAPDPAQ
ncbi:mannosyltransferase [Rhodococcus sp. TAF43]|uniref:mannosyltransferase n=1 Tax=unclassified Rhodococcus (in: high G+C Gram-positive bacteria) TaxID=192944 RepID=UPI000E0AB7A3|nr:MULTISPECIES: mannosyltransferase [unclassified Rhodococcus (in: high G+C Gram-positive bacteria)]QKT10752.1 mannosyltransferase [Rhodococcus sp. W8901]RDI35919.1 alpha-1,2-mannosyltransferase [Rhodococcus sp. AG1013]